MAGDGWRWADLPNDLLGTVYLRATSAYDRARFAAVCTTWRAAASCHRPLPPLPLLLLSPGSGTSQREALAYSHEDGRAVHIPLQWLPWGDRLVGSHDGGWIATVSRSDELLVVNLFSGTRVPVPTKQKLENATMCACPNYSTMSRGLLSGLIYIKKVIFSADPSSTSCILAAMTQLCSVALCRVGSSNGDWTTLGWGAMLTDITFCNGELYGFQRGALFKFGIDVNKDGNLVASPIHRLNIKMNALHELEVTSHPRYIFQLRSKLAIAVEVWPESHDHNTKFFRVFELTNDCKMWEEVMSLDDHTLFLDPACSKAVPVSVMDGRGGVDRNCIYYSEQDASLHHHVECLAKLYIGSCTVYYRKSEGVHHLQRIISRGYHYRKWDAGNGRNCCMWLLPPEF